MKIDLRPGSKPVAGYTLIERLGRGGFGEVWKAAGPGGIRLALKFVALDEQVGKVELRALKVVQDIRHPHLLSTFGSWQIDETLVIAMELADRTLMDRFREAVGQGFPGIPAPEIFEHFLDASKGLDFLNEPRHPTGGKGPQGIQHRDIKPQNLLLVGGSVKVADFGLARMLEHSTTGHTGSMTPSYAAPEFFEQKTSSQSDQYSLAVSYCQLRGGRLPFEGNPAAVISGHLYRQPDLSMLPVAERAAVVRALAKSPRDRWPSCREFLRAVTSANDRGFSTITAGTRKPADSQASTIPITRPPSPAAKGFVVSKVDPQRKPKKVVQFLVVVCVLGVAGLGIWGSGVLSPRDQAEVAALAVNPDAKPKSDPIDEVPAVPVPVPIPVPPAPPAPPALPALPAPIPTARETSLTLFNGKDLTGWKTDPKQPGEWFVEDGKLIGLSGPSHLFTERDDFENFQLLVEARINSKGNSGVYFRSEYGLNLLVGGRSGIFPKGYEAQIYVGDGTDKEQRTGSLYNFSPVEAQLVQPDVWFVMEVIAEGNRIRIKVDGEDVVDFTDDKNTYLKGYIALQCHDPSTRIEFRWIEIKELR